MKLDYKKTEVGTIPEDWEVKNLGEFCTFTQGVQVPQSEQIRDSRSGYIRYLYIRDFFTDEFQWFVKDQYPSKIMSESDIMMVNTGSTAGKVYTGAKGVLSNNAFRIRFDESIISRDFLFEFLKSQTTQEKIRNLYNSAAQPHVGHKNIAQVPIGLPPLAEQRVIAEALSDVDELLNGLDRLIAKKRDLKQAAMQQLLIGKTRLPGEWNVNTGYKQTEVGVIPEDWNCAPIGEVSNICVGRDLHEERFSTMGDSTYRFPVYSNTVVNEGLYGFYSIPEYEGDSLTVVGRGVGLGTAFARKGSYGAIGRLLVLLPKYCADAQFLATYINHKINIFIETGGIPQLTGIQFSKYKVALPHISEQRMIAAVLSDMDTEIAALEHRRKKTLALKQAMMQELLTGKTRLVDIGDSHARTTTS